MKQIVLEVLQAEEAINARLKETRAQAARITATAEQEVAAKTAETQDEVRLIIQHAVEEARKAAEQLRAERLAAADREKESLLTGRAETIDQLIERICETIVTAEEQGSD